MTTPPNTLQLDASATNQRGSHGSLQSVPMAQPRPTILMPSDWTTIHESAERLYQRARESGRFFRRGITVQNLVGAGDDSSLRLLNTHSARSAFETIGSIKIMRSPRPGLPAGPERCLVGADHANQLLECIDGVLTLPEVEAITNVPILAKTATGPKQYDGGYVPELKLLIMGSIEVPSVSFNEGVATLLGLLEEFDFQTPSDKSRAFAAFITPALHFGGWLSGEPVPVDIAEADQSQSGKTYRHKLVAAIYRDRPDYVDNKEKGVGGLDESIQSLIFAGRPFIALDNMKVKLDSGYLEQVITNTTGRYRIRLPHMRETEVPGRFILMVSSNAAKMSVDLANRASITRIAKREGYQFRSNPLATVQADPARFLGSVFAIIRHWAEAGQPTDASVDHDFRKWAGAMSWIVREAGLAPLLDGHREVQARAGDTTLTFLRDLALGVEARGDLQNPLATTTLIEIAAERGIVIPGIDVQSTDETARSRAAQLLGIKLAVPFRKKDTITIDKFQIERLEVLDDRKEEAKGSRLVKRYKVSIRDQKGPQ